jgi:hypothetical protein
VSAAEEKAQAWQAVWDAMVQGNRRDDAEMRRALADVVEVANQREDG